MLSLVFPCLPLESSPTYSCGSSCQSHDRARPYTILPISRPPPSALLFSCSISCSDHGVLQRARALSLWSELKSPIVCLCLCYKRSASAASGPPVSWPHLPPWAPAPLHTYFSASPPVSPSSGVSSDSCGPLDRNFNRWTFTSFIAQALDFY